MVALTLGLVGIGIRAVLDYQIRTSIDSGLQQSAARVVPELANPSPPPNDSEFQSAINECVAKHVVTPALRDYCTRVQVQLDQNLLQLAPGQFEQAQILDLGSYPQQIPLLWSRTASANGVAIDVLSMVQAARGGNSFLTVPCEGDTCRVYLTPLVLPTELRANGVIGTLEVFQRERNYIDIQRQVDLILLLGIPLGVLVAIFAGWWIARAALRPIDRISRTVQKIGDSGDLSRRTDFIGPQDEVGRLAATFDTMMDRLEGAFDAQKRFVADASHELRTPLTAIRGNADLMRIAPPEERELCLQSIRRESERMSRLVNDLLLLAEADADPQSIHKTEIDLDEVLSEVYRSVQVIAGDKMTVRYEPLADTRLVADPDRLKQLFLNLIDNAVKFTPAGGEVRMSVRRDETGVRISVSDSGMGISPEEQQAVFRRFYRLEESRTKRGSGLGLAICAWIVAAHQGTIDLVSEPGHGTTFTVYLPGVIDTGETIARVRRAGA
jgi:signal transduction histidine kinase